MLIDKVVEDDRKKRNQDSLIAAASGKESHLVKVTPAQRRKQQEEVDPAKRTVAPGPVKPRPKAGAKADPSKPPGRARGKGGAQSFNSEVEAPTWTGVPRKALKDYPGTDVKDVPADQRCCLQYCYVGRKTGLSLCNAFNQGKDCPLGKHVAPGNLTPAMKKTNIYAKYIAERGPMNCPSGGPKAPQPPPEKA